MACPACGGPGRPDRLVVEECYRLHHCEQCRTQFFVLEGSPSDHRSRESAYWEDYKFAVYSNPAVRADYQRRYEHLLGLAEQRVGAVRSLLDVGCGIGNFLAYASGRGIDAVGVDVEARAVEAARDRGLRAYLVDELDREVPDGSLDAATMWDVVEHLLDPLDGVTSMARKVRPGGALLFETPDAMFPARRAVLALDRISRGRADLTDPFYYLEHRTYFTEDGLRRLLERCGCRLMMVERVPSPRHKMSGLFAAEGADGDRVKALLARGWPVLESIASRVRLGNKLLAVAQRL